MTATKITLPHAAIYRHRDHHRSPSQLTVQTPGAGFTDLTAEVAKFVREAGAREGAVTLFIRHTSASLTIQENADPTVLDDLMTALQASRARKRRMAP